MAAPQPDFHRPHSGERLLSVTRARLLPYPVACVLLVLAVFLAGCGDSSKAATPNSSSVPAQTPGARPTTPATLEIVNPTSNQVTGTNFTAQFKLTGGTFAAQTSANVTPDQGFIHVSVDNQQVEVVATTDVPLFGLTPGPHTLSGEYVASDHAPFANRVIVTVPFTVQ